MFDNSTDRGNDVMVGQFGFFSLFFSRARDFPRNLNRNGHRLSMLLHVETN